MSTKRQKTWAVLSELLDERSADGLVITGRADIRWASGFSGSNGLLYVTPRARILITDGRYREQAARQTDGVDVRIIQGSVFEGLAGFMETTATRRLLLQSDVLTVRDADTIRKSFPAVDLVFEADLLAVARARKSDDEVSAINAALRISERVLALIPDILKPGVREREVSAEIDYRHSLEGGEGPAFDTIVLFGAHAALPHGAPGNTVLSEGDPVLIDTGCLIDGYASDITRMFMLGTPAAEFAEAYQAVHDAMQRAVHVARAGLCASDLDFAARSVLEEAGLGDWFTHSLGHGVGLDIHEWPRIGQKSDAVLPDGVVITVEPGVYLEGKFGIRIENMILVTEKGAVTMNESPTELTIL